TGAEDDTGDKCKESFHEALFAEKNRKNKAITSFPPRQTAGIAERSTTVTSPPMPGSLWWHSA
ncbi:MAG TPA: hypothetical protein PLM08_15670, partial [Polyangiaceae bacterium]|nr:hypothetical protein [Polyangiaceae bacterium]